MSEEYTDVHSAFLQVCANRGTLNLSSALGALVHIKNRYDDNVDAPTINLNSLREIVNRINDKLQEFELKLVFVTLELDLAHTEFLVYTHTTESAVLKIPVLYTETECNFLKLLLERIVTSGSCSLSSITALNLTSTSMANATQSGHKKISKIRLQELIEEWCNKGYLVDINDIVYVGPRTIAEFGYMLRTKFPDHVRLCYLCSQTIFQGLHCPQDTCDTILHKKCSKSYLTKSKKCPKCKKPWTLSD